MMTEYGLQAKETGVYLDPYDFAPRKSLQLDLWVKYEAQQDGHAWSAEQIEKETNKLIEDAVQEIRTKVGEFVRTLNPYG